MKYLFNMRWYASIASNVPTTPAREMTRGVKKDPEDVAGGGPILSIDHVLMQLLPI